MSTNYAVTTMRWHLKTTQREKNAEAGVDKKEGGRFFSRVRDISINPWLSKNWTVFVMLIGIFILALFLRYYFSFDISTREGFLLSGGSDSYYHKRCIDYAITTGHHLFKDPLLNYPGGAYNGRPPLYDWSVALAGMLLSPFFQGDVAIAVWYAFLFSTALWGALTIFPLYALTKEMFGKKAGLISAFLLAIMAGHLQRSPLTNGDHDAFALFFVVTVFYFLLKSLKNLQNVERTSNWKRPGEFVHELGNLIKSNRKSILYAMLSGISIATIALTWKGYTYVIVIILIYYLTQLVINRFRNEDSFGVVMCISISIGLGFLLAYPYYSATGFVKGWFETPFYLFLAALGIGLMFIATQRHPWTLVAPSAAITIAVTFSILFVVFPQIANAIVEALVRSATYLVKTKVYETIAEAQAPNYSNLILSFGAVTFYFSLAGLAWFAIQLRKNWRIDYLFIIIWSGASIYMAMSAARFIFNASPAFAMAAGFLIATIVERLDLKTVRKTFWGLKGNKIYAIKRSVKVRHVVAALFIVFIIVLPNVWNAVDASIPFEEKKQYDKDVYEATPTFMRPENYDAINGSNWYFGAFGYSLPLESRAWPNAYKWLASQDNSTIPYEDRPAFLSWWDYGFEVIGRTDHPSVAENFQHGIEIAGNSIMAQNETEAIALLASRLLDGCYHSGKDITNILERYELDAEKIYDVYRNKNDYIDEVKNAPDLYGPYDEDLSGENAKYAVLRIILGSLGEERLVALLYDLEQESGYSIRYFAIDSRLFPFSAQNTGIFYAPAKLSDRRMVTIPGSFRDIPIDFYDIIVIDEYGGEHSVTDMPPGTRIASYRIDYKDMFFKTMLYRTFIGYSGEEIGMTDDAGIPGLSGDLAQYPPMQAWNLAHFRLVYKTAYWNPYPMDEVQEHPEAWKAISYAEALEHQEKIQKGEEEGVVDLNPRSGLYNGVVIIKYYHGAFVNGTVRIENGEPYPNALITVQDEYGIPHYLTQTDSNGHYSAIAPFGEVRITVSTGEENPLTKMGDKILNSTTVIIKEEQAMREKVDRDRDGKWDYNIEKDFTVKGANIKGIVYWDLNKNGNYDDEPVIPDATMTMKNVESDKTNIVHSDLEGNYELNNTLSGEWEITLSINGHSIGGFFTTAELDQTTTADLGIKPATVEGKVVYVDGASAGEVQVEIYDSTNDTTFSAQTDAAGDYHFTKLLPGGLTLSAFDQSFISLSSTFAISQGEEVKKNITLYQSTKIHGYTKVSGSKLANLTIKFENEDKNEIKKIITSKSNGFYDVILPQGVYSVYAKHVVDGKTYVYLDEMNATTSTDIRYDVDLENAMKLEGVCYADSKEQRKKVTITFDGDAELTISANAAGAYRVYLPKNTYTVKVSHSIQDEGYAYLESLDLECSQTYDIELVKGVKVDGDVYYDVNSNGVKDEAEGLETELTFIDENGKRLYISTDGEGAYLVYLVPNRTYSVLINEFGFLPVRLPDEGYITTQEIITNRNFVLSPINATVSGRLLFNGSVFEERVNITFEADGSGAMTQTVLSPSDGNYTVSLRPGSYAISIDHNITANGTIKYRNVDKYLNIEIGGGFYKKDIDLIEKVRVDGMVYLYNNKTNADLTLIGPEKIEISIVNGTFDFYVESGIYTIFANSTEESIKYTYMDHLEIEKNLTLNISLERAVRLYGTIIYQNESIDMKMPLLIEKEGGGSVSSHSDDNGEYEVHLSQGNYVISINYTTTETFNGKMRYIRYTSTRDVVITNERKVGIELYKTLNNVTFSGDLNVTGYIKMEFVAHSESAINATTLSDANGEYEVKLAPGDYTLYIHDEITDKVHFDVVTIPPHDVFHNITLVDGYKVHGVASYNLNQHASTTITLEGDGKKMITSNSDGYYEIFVPQGNYTLSARCVMVEHGVNVTYNYTQSIAIDRAKKLNIQLDKIKEYGVEISWDASMTKEIGQNESIEYNIVVSNVGNVDDGFYLEGEPNNWGFEFSENNFALPMGTTGNSKSIKVKITSPIDAKVDHGTIKITATSQNSSAASYTQELIVEIFQVHGIEITSSDKNAATDGTTTTYTLEVKNSGNAEDSYTLTILNIDELKDFGWDVKLAVFDNEGETISNVSTDAYSLIDLTIKTRTLKDKVKDTKIMILGYSEGNMGSNDVFSISLYNPKVKIDNKDVSVTGTGLSDTIAPADYTWIISLIAMVVIGSAFAFFILRKKGVIKW